MKNKTWAQRWKDAAKDWRKIAIRRGIKHRTRTEQDRMINEQWYQIRYICNKARRLINAMEREESPEKIAQALRLLKGAEKGAWEYMSQYMMPWEDR